MAVSPVESGSHFAMQNDNPIVSDTIKLTMDQGSSMPWAKHPTPGVEPEAFHPIDRCVQPLAHCKAIDPKSTDLASTDVPRAGIYILF